MLHKTATSNIKIMRASYPYIFLYHLECVVLHAILLQRYKKIMSLRRIENKNITKAHNLHKFVGLAIRFMSILLTAPTSRKRNAKRLTSSANLFMWNCLSETKNTFKREN